MQISMLSLFFYVLEQHFSIEQSILFTVPNINIVHTKP